MKKDLSDNCIQNAEALGKLEFLLSINLANNQLLEIPAALDHRKFLQQANFTKNYIREMHIQHMPMLVHLTLNRMC